MILIAAATENEIKSLRLPAVSRQAEIFITGMGPVATAASLSRHLTLRGTKIDAVLNIGVAGAYYDSGVTMLDICLAQQESLGDFGICMQDRIIDFQPELGTTVFFTFKNELIPRFKNILTNQNIVFKNVNFVTVNCCTGTKKRGEFLRRKYGAGCENMEGAAVAMVCQNFNIPCVELRCISNMVDDRDTTKWRFSEAVDKICRVVDTLLQVYLQDRSSSNQD
jgi:futalosine hydrolase